MKIGIIGQGVMASILSNIINNSDDECYFIDFNNDNSDVDVLIDFSHPILLPQTLKLVQDIKKPIVMCTTGYSLEEELEIKQLEDVVPYIYTKNTSLGVAILNHLVKKATLLLEDFDIEIIEKHHNLKVDAPSGTAKLLLNSIQDVREDSNVVYDRSQINEKRTSNEIGVHTIRGGSIVGDHSVIYAGKGEVIELSHQAISKDLFAQGAIKAALFLSRQTQAQEYNMSDVLGLND